MVDKAKGKEAVVGKNMSVWFPDEAVAKDLEKMADRLHSSSSAIIYELVKQCLPAIDQNSDKRDIPLDGVKVRL